MAADPREAPRPRRALCARCGRPAPRGCLCALAAPVANAVEVLVLRHPDEAREAKGTVALMALCLARCRVIEGERIDAAAAGPAPPGGDWLLYPDVPAFPAPRAVPAASGLAVGRLVVLDATWRKSLRLLALSPWLQALPRLVLPEAAAAGPTAYARLRAADRPGQLSTLEATGEALARLEGDSARYRPLHDALAAFVARSLTAHDGG